MSRHLRHLALRRTVLALAALATCGPMLAQTAETASKAIAEPAGEAKDKAGTEAAAEDAISEVKAEGSVDFGIAGLSGNSADRALFGQYNGMRVRGTVGLLGFALARRDAASGTSMELVGQNLALDTRELALRLWSPGEWKLRADFYQRIHYDPYTPNTGLLGFGTTTPQVSVLAGGPGTGLNQDLSLKRLGLGMAFSSVINPSLQLDVSAKTENKTGSRLFGIGFSCPSSVAPGCRSGTGSETGSAVLMLPEPVDANHTQLEARLSWAGEKLRISAGYYGSFYSNAYGTLNPQIPDSLNNPVGSLLPLSAGLQSILGNPVALPPNNQAHQIDVTGVYAFSPTTNANFRLGYSLATQDQDFAGAGLTGAPPGVTNLGAKVSTTLLQVGLTSRPVPKLSLAANLRYNDVDDRTPLADYNIQGTNLYTNMQLPRTTVRATAAANYQFSPEYRGTLGVSYENIDRGVFTPTSAVSGVSALRQSTEETGVKAELRRSFSDNVSGSISVASSRRDGSNWLRVNSGRGVTEVPDPNDPANGFGPEAIFMPTLANRQRDKLKFLVDWQPLEVLSLQFSAEGGRDSYTTPSSQGLRNADMNLFNADWDLAISTNWSVNGYVSRGNQSYLQSRPAGYIMAYSNTGTYAGLGVTGKPAGKLRVGGGLTYTDDTSEYAQTLEASAPTSSALLLEATGGLPDIVFRQVALKLFGTYDLDKRSSVRFDLMYQWSRWTDWAWGYNGVPFTTADGTTMNQLTEQRVAFLGVSYSYTWR